MIRMQVCRWIKIYFRRHCALVSIMLFVRALNLTTVSALLVNITNVSVYNIDLYIYRYIKVAPKCYKRHVPCLSFKIEI